MATTFKKYGNNVLIERGIHAISVPISSFVKPDPRDENFIVITDIGSIQNENAGIRIDIREITGLNATTRNDIVKELNYYYFVELGLDIDTSLSLNYGMERLYKFGRNANVTATEEIVHDGGDGYTFLDAAEPMQIYSSSAADTAAGTGAREVHIFGEDDNFNRIEEFATLNGVTPVTLTSNFRFIYRIKVSKAGSGHVNAGTITLETVAANIAQAQILPNNGQTLMCIYVVPAGYKLLIEEVNAWAGKGWAIVAKLKVRNLGVTDGAWQTKGVADVFQGDIPEKIYEVVPEKHAVIITAQNVDQTTIEVSAKFAGKLILMNP